MLRVPGTWRTKPDAPEPLPVQLLWGDGARFTVDELDTMAISAAAADRAEPRSRSTAPAQLDGVRGAAVGPVLTAQIRDTFAERLAKLATGDYVSGNYVDLRDLACWAGGREEQLGDPTAQLMRAARASGTVEHRGLSVCVRTIDSGVALGRREPYSPMALRSVPDSATAPARSDLARSAQSARARITVNHRQSRDVERDIIEALAVYNADRPRMFDHGGEIVEISRGHRVRPLGDKLYSVVAQAADFFHVSGWAVGPPKDVLRALAAHDAKDLGLPPLEGFSTLPIMRPDGTIRTAPGYDPQTRIYFEPGEVAFPAIPEQPTESEIEAARATLLTEWGEFPYRDETSRCNALALLFTTVLRPAVKGPVPMAVITASTRGTGKTLLAETILSVAEGEEVPSVDWPSTEDERRKAITTHLRSGRPLFFDNLNGKLASDALSMLLTTSVWSARILGTSTAVEIPVRAVTVVTGNGIQVHGDLDRRVFYVELDAAVFRPELRTGFEHADLRGHVLANRVVLAHAVLVLARSWFAAGRPAPECAALGSYEGWRTVIGGILQHAGIPGFLASSPDLLDDPEMIEWEVFLEALDKHFAPASSFTAGDATEAIEQNAVTWRDSVPGDLANKLRRPGLDPRRSVGDAFRYAKGRRFNPAGIRIETSELNRGRVALWRIVRDQHPADVF